MNDVNISHQRSNYRLLGLVGNGQFGRVYCGVHRKTGQLVAIKYLHRHSLPTHAFLRELHCLLRLAHPNIVACHALEHTTDGRRLVLEYCAGGTLRSHMLSSLSLTNILTLTLDVLRGLAHAHQQGVIHCDIKPENILLNYYDGRWRAKISDFGIAKLVHEQPYRKGSGQTGSPAYMAPERFYCQYSPAADIYAVGIMLFELLVGQRPFTGTPTALQLAHLNQPVPEINQQLFAPLQPIIAKALEKLPARRYSDATAMLADLHCLDPLNLEQSLPPRQGISTYSPYAGEPIHQLMKPVGHLKKLSPSSVDQTTIIPQVVIAHKTQLATLKSQSISYSTQILESPIRGVYPSHTGLFVSTERTLWHGQSIELLTPLTCWQASALIDIEPNKQWIAAVIPSAQQLIIIKLKNYHEVDCTTKYPLSPNINIQKVLVIDSGHLVIIGNSHNTGTQLQFWNRRGMYLTSMTLGINLQQLTPMRHQPHQWMAIDANRPQTVIFLTLKPLRITPITLDITPSLMLDLPWGYLFSDTTGRLLLLDRDFYPIGGVQGPLGATAMATVSPHELLIATWQTKIWQTKIVGTGAIHYLNLQDFDLDIIF